MDRFFLFFFAFIAYLLQNANCVDCQIGSLDSDEAPSGGLQVKSLFVNFSEREDLFCSSCNSSSYECVSGSDNGTLLQVLNARPRGHCLLSALVTGMNMIWCGNSTQQHFLSVNLNGVSLFLLSKTPTGENECDCDLCRSESPQDQHTNFTSCEDPYSEDESVEIEISPIHSDVCVSSLTVEVLFKYVPPLPVDCFSTESDSPSDISTSVVIAASVCGFVVFTTVMIGGICFLLRRRPDSGGAEIDLEEDIRVEEDKIELTPQDVSQIFDTIPELSNISVEHKIGNGKFGEVYLGNWDGVNVALKKLKDDGDLLSFQREAIALFNKNHPHVVQFLGIFVSEGAPYIVLEHMSKGS
eukprot:TRINITY_DN4952_c0_g1_i1.p1 TRINITY_DN4952_c0_g1~~TRINITY_DN4952_c0_g1_i1.p1  ORF type:complete len:355 (+),score=55.08 TRINITY_DN4952_c0_g1_i1:204-1268(+)